MTNNEFIDRYRILSRTGRFYTREMLINAASRMCGPGHRKAIRECIDNDAFMAPRAGYTPGALADDVFGWVFSR